MHQLACLATVADSGGVGQNVVAGDDMIKLAAFTVGFILLIVGTALSIQQFLDFPVLNDIVRPSPVARSQVGLFGLLFFGTGLSLMLTQVFAEHYGAKIAGLAFVGTLAALYIFMLIAKSTVFDFEVEVDVSEFYPRDLELEIRCGQQGFRTDLAQARKPLVTISGAPERVSLIRDAVIRYQDKFITPAERPPILLESVNRVSRFEHVGNADRDIMIMPIADEGNYVGFMIPYVVFSEKDRITFYVADDKKVIESGSSRPAEPLSSVRVLSLSVDKTISYEENSLRPIIRAEIDLVGVANVCGQN